MNSSNPLIHEIDTRHNNAITVFDGSREDESKLAKQFWNSVLLMPPVESTLVCKEIQQRTKSRPMNKPRVDTSTVKASQEKISRDKEHEEIAALKNAEDEARRIQAVRQRHEYLRQLFFKQARTNRVKHQQWAIPHINNYPMNRHAQQSSNYYQEELLKDYRHDDEYDRQLVQLLPD